MSCNRFLLARMVGCLLHERVARDADKNEGNKRKRPELRRNTPSRTVKPWVGGAYLVTRRCYDDTKGGRGVSPVVGMSVVVCVWK